jgi:hypothetical protein
VASQGGQGAQGPSGSPGPPGPTGAQGAQGATGPSAVTCYSFVLGQDVTYYGACAFAGTVTAWQQSASLDFGMNLYRSEGYCQASICDWDGFALYVSNSLQWHQTSYTCGFSVAFGYCGFYSDVRLKHGVETIKNAIENIMKLEAVEYDWNENLNEFEYFKTQQKLHTIGLIAQNVRLYYPEVVKINSDGYYSIDYSKLNAVLVEGIKEQSIFIEEIDKELDYIETKLN